jgi:hypothetical protein
MCWSFFLFFMLESFKLIFMLIIKICKIQVTWKNMYGDNTCRRYWQVCTCWLCYHLFLTLCCFLLFFPASHVPLCTTRSLQGQKT